MDFRTVTEKLSDSFAANSVQYALIGGYAVSLLGLPRATVVLDFLVRRDDMEKVRRGCRKILRQPGRWRSFNRTSTVLSTTVNAPLSR